MSWIQTYTGERFPLLAPHQGHVWLADIAHALANQCRFNGHCREFYSVAQHSLIVAQLAPPSLRLEALLHDAAEAYLGDIVTPLKSFLTFAFPGFDEIEDQIQAAIHRRFGLACDETGRHPVRSPAVKLADLTALAIERRDLLAPGLEWDLELPVAPDRVDVAVVWPPAKAEALFAAEVLRVLEDEHRFFAPAQALQEVRG